ncbi:MAG: hypothetical protein WCF82_04045 [Microcoleus sp.]
MGLITLGLQRMLSTASFYLKRSACILNQTYQTPGAIAFQNLPTSEPPH